jgi:hypothetical protein
VHDAPRDQADRSRQVEGRAGAVEDRGHVAHVAVHDGHAGGALGHHGLEVIDHDRVVVDVHHLGVGVDRPGRLERVRCRRQPAAQVDELADPLLGGPDHGAGEELAVLDRYDRDQRNEGEQALRELAVGGEVVLAAEYEVVDPRDARGIRVKVGHNPILWQRAPQLRGHRPCGSGPGPFAKIFF